MSGNEPLKDVTLRPWPAPKKEKLSQLDLLEQIEQLTTERGHLRDITEQSLQKDIDNGEDAPEANLEGATPMKQEKKELTKDEQLREVFRTQHEMASHLEWARFAANNAIDILSLVLSADPKHRHPQSFSATFRTEGIDQGIPYGSFGASREDHNQHVRKPDEIKGLQDYDQRQELVAKGSRMEALDTATDEILKAAKKLEREVRRETKYWQEIVSISDKGWPLHRLRQNARNVPFVVRYGLPEANDHFKARGVAPLRMHKDGSIILDPALALKPKTLRVRISENGEIVGSSRLSLETEKDIALEKTIELARESLFEEELYHEMSLETRQLLPYGVEFRDSVICFNVPGTESLRRQRKILIDCIPRDERIPNDEEHWNDWLAQNVAEGLRMLLAHEHSMRLNRRSQIPPPLTSKKRDKPQPPILRTLVAITNHLQGVDSLYEYLENVAATLNNAGLAVTLETTRESSWAELAKKLQAPSKRELSASDRLLETFMKPFEGDASLSISFPSGAQPEVLTVSTRTVIGVPTFGTEHKLSLPSSMASDLGLFPNQSFSPDGELKSYLDWVLSLHIAHRQLKADFHPRVTVKHHESGVIIRSVSGKKGPADWDIVVRMEGGDLRLIATPTNMEQVTEDSQQTSTWNKEIGEASIKDKVASWVG